MKFSVLYELGEADLRSLIASFNSGALSHGISTRPLQGLAGSQVAELELCLRSLNESGMSPAHIGLLVQAVLDGLPYRASLSDFLQLVLTGPEIPEIPCGDTAAVLHALVEEAEREVLLVGYAVYDGEKIFEALASRMDSCPELDVTFCLDVQRKYGDERSASELAVSFSKRFREKQWPGKRLPMIYYDPRSLLIGAQKRSSLHAKGLVVDRRTALITSANYTEAAQERNIELGVLLRSELHARRIVEYFKHLIEKDFLIHLDLD